VDTARLRQLGQELEQLTSDLSSQIYRIAGHEFNIDSPKQLASVLFEELKLPAQRRTKSSYSTSAAVLERLAEEHEVARLIMEYREYAKLRSTYVDGLLGLVDRQGRVHTTFEQMVTSTGRLSSRNPNLQNIPVRTEWGRRIRACFVPPEDGWALLSADYSQIELRILAHLSRDPALVNAFERGEDVHTRTASLIFGIPPQEVDAAKRRVAKTVNFALIYGQGAVALAQQIGVSREEAEAFIANYFRRLPKVKEYLERALAEAREKKYVETIFGRRRYVHEIASEDGRTRSYAERAAVNAPIQGSAADIIKIAMVHVHDCLAQERLQSRLLLQVHDELLFEAPEEEVEKLASCVREVMEAADEGKLSVPLTVDVKIGPNWRDMEVI
jgi:DNA polymerase-1